ncbi:MAG: hypothetical protein ABR540_14325 [Acidimicrobiales bacterium]
MTARHKTLADVLAEQRDEPTPFLDLQLPLLRLLDVPYCESVNKKLVEVAGEWEVMVATERAADRLPAEPGLYMFVWRPPLRFKSPAKPDSFAYILYVGKAGAEQSDSTIKKRYREYARYLAGEPDLLWREPLVRDRRNLFGRYLKLEPLELWYTVIPDRQEVSRLEKQLVHMLNPPLNDQLTPKVRLTTPQPAFRRPDSSQGAS